MIKKLFGLIWGIFQGSGFYLTKTNQELYNGINEILICKSPMGNKDYYKIV